MKRSTFKHMQTWSIVVMIAGASYLVVALEPQSYFPDDINLTTLGGVAMVLGAVSWYIAHRKLEK